MGPYPVGVLWSPFPSLCEAIPRMAVERPLLLLSPRYVLIPITKELCYCCVDFRYTPSKRFPPIPRGVMLGYWWSGSANGASVRKSCSLRIPRSRYHLDSSSAGTSRAMEQIVRSVKLSDMKSNTLGSPPPTHTRPERYRAQNELCRKHIRSDWTFIILRNRHSKFLKTKNSTSNKIQYLYHIIGQ